MLLFIVGGLAVTTGAAALLSHLGRSQPLVTPEVPEAPVRLIHTRGDAWTCRYCLTDNVKTDGSCVTCGSPRKFSKVVSA